MNGYVERSELSLLVFPVLPLLLLLVLELLLPAVLTGLGIHTALFLLVVHAAHLLYIGVCILLPGEDGHYTAITKGFFER